MMDSENWKTTRMALSMDFPRPVWLSPRKITSGMKGREMESWIGTGDKGNNSH